MMSLDDEIDVLRVDWAEFEPLTADYTKKEYQGLFNVLGAYSGERVSLSELENNLSFLGEKVELTELPEKLQTLAVSARRGMGKMFYLVEGLSTCLQDSGFDERLELGILTYPDLDSGPRLMPLMRIYFER